MRALTSKQKAEIDRLRTKHGTVTPERVVAFASNPKTALHRRFVWDDTEAAHQYRVFQARQVLRVYVYVPEGQEKTVRAFVSLQTDRHIGVGYRHIEDVMSDPEMRAQLLDEALDELRVFQKKYRRLKELAPVFAAAKRVAGRRGKRAVPA